MKKETFKVLLEERFTKPVFEVVHTTSKKCKEYE